MVEGRLHKCLVLKYVTFACKLCTQVLYWVCSLGVPQIEDSYQKTPLLRIDNTPPCGFCTTPLNVISISSHLWYSYILSVHIKPISVLI